MCLGTVGDDNNDLGLGNDRLLDLGVRKFRDRRTVVLFKAAGA
jgi:hypothetical protein